MGPDPQLAAARPACPRLPRRLAAVGHDQDPHPPGPPAGRPGDRPLDRLRLPSGHTTKATATYGLLVATTPRWSGKVAGWTAALLLAGLVALSRLYLGASWLIDVLGAFSLGAFSLGAAWLFALLTATRVVGGLQGHTAATHPPPTGRQPAQAAPVATPANDHRPARPKQHGG